MRKLSLIVNIVVLGAVLATAACKKKEDSSTEDMVNLISLYMTYQFINPSFVNSCNSAASFFCINSYGSALSCTGGTTNSASKCTATSAIGSCRGSTQETVFYAGYSNCTDDSTCQTRCTNILGGTYSANYTP